MAEEIDYKYEAIQVTSAKDIDVVMKRLNSLGASGYRFVGQFESPLPGTNTPEVCLLMEKEMATVTRRGGRTIP